MNQLLQRPSVSRALDHALIALPLAVTIIYARYFWARHVGAFDFQFAYRVAGRQLLSGLSPYAATSWQVHHGVFFLYPALAALAFVPFALIPSGISSILFTVICVAALLGSLWVLGVRDRRIFGLVLLWSPVVTAWQAANVTLLLVFAIALLWRHRDNRLVAGALVALCVSIKPLVWPLGLWLLVTRRYVAAAWALAIGLAFNAVAWAIVGFNQVSAFVRISHTGVQVLHGMGYSIVSVASQAGLSASLGAAAQVGLAVGLAGVCLATGRRGRDLSALATTITLMLVASPVVDFHYFALLVVPIAIARPHLNPAWAVPLALWGAPPMGYPRWEAAIWWLAVAWLLLAVIRVADRGRAESPDTVVASLPRLIGSVAEVRP